jgi:hypothetical protein
MWWIPRVFCILESKSLKINCNVHGLEDFLTFECWILLWSWLRLVLGIVLKRLITVIFAASRTCQCSHSFDVIIATVRHCSTHLFNPKQLSIGTAWCTKHRTFCKSSRWFELSSSNSGHNPVDWNDYTKSCIWVILHHIDVGTFYFAMFDEFHQHTKVHGVYRLCVNDIF